jgi:nicotinate-nucleotide adenylyltransferase
VEARRPAKSYSIDTVRLLQAQYGTGVDLAFILGLDAFLDFPTWRQASELLRLCDFVVVSRTGASFASLANCQTLVPVTPQALQALDCRIQDRLDIPVPGGSRVTFLSLPPCPLSASEIRRRIRHGLSITSLLPAAVESYIMRCKLYQNEPDCSGGQA